jgi:hypothetical protein
MPSWVRKKHAVALVGAALLACAAPVVGAGEASAASVATWEALAQCEASGNWSIVHTASDGTVYYGGLQFDQPTWQAYGGTAYAPNASLATEQQQILIGEKVLAGPQGQNAWPNCGPKVGLAADTANPYPSPTTSPMFGVDGSGNLRYYKYTGDGSSNMTWTGTSNNVVSNAPGWGKFTHVFSGGGGVIYAIDTAGNLWYYNYTGDGSSTGSWSATSNSIISNSPGWGKFTQVFSTGNGRIFGVDGSGNLWYYQYTGDGSSTGTWSATSNSIVSNSPGWGKFTHIAGDPTTGAIYGTDSAGNLWYYNYTGDGSSNMSWSSTSNNIISNSPGWGKFNQLFSTGNGELEGVDSSGNLWYLQYTGDGSSNMSWSSHSNSIISNSPGWNGLAAF